MATTATLAVNLETNAATFMRGMDQMAKSVDKMAGSVNRSLGAAANAFKMLGAAAAGLALANVLHEAVKASSEAEESLKKVEQTIRSTGGAAGVTIKQVTDLSAALQRQTGVSDDALNAASALMLTFTKVSKEVFPQSIKVVNDMSVALGQDLKSSSIQVGKALNDPIKGITALQRVGVSFTAEQKNMVKALVESGRTMDAQKLILKELETEFGGAAAAARDTLGGAYKALQNETGELMEALGAGSSGLRGVVELGVAALQEMQDGVTSLQDWFKSGVQSSTEFKNGLKLVAEGAGFVWESIKAGINSVVTLGTTIGEVVTAGAKGFQMMGEVIYSWLPKPLKEAVDWTGKLIQQIGQGMFNAPKDFNEGLRKNGKDVAGDLERSFTGMFDRIKARADKNVADIQAAAKNFKGVKINPEGGVELGPTKEEAKVAKELESTFKKYADEVSRLGDASNHRTAALAAQTEEQKEQLRLTEELQKIDDAIFMVRKDWADKEKKLQGNKKEYDKERLAMEGAIGDMLETRQKIQANFEADQAQLKRNHMAEEKKDLAELLESMKLQTVEAKAQSTGKEDDLKRAKLQAELDKIIKTGHEEDYPIVKQIREEFEKQLALTGDTAKEAEKLKKIHEEDLKNARELLATNDDEIRNLASKAEGYGDISKKLADIRKIEQSSLDPMEKRDALAAIDQQYAAMDGLNNQMKRQDQLLDAITKGNRGYVNTSKDLEFALNTGQITLTQYQDEMFKLSTSSKEASDAGKDFASSITKGLADGIEKGQKFSDILKGIGKNLLVMGSKRLLEPLIGLGFDSILRKFGIGGTPGLGGSAGMINNASRVPVAGGIATGAGGVGGTIQGGNVVASGPVYVNSGNALINSNNVGGGLFDQIKNLLSSLTSGITGLLGGLLKIPQMLLGAFSGLFGGGGLLGGIFNAGKNLLGGALGGIGRLFGFGSSSSGGVIPGYGGSVNGYSGSSMMGGGYANFYDLQGYANGGMASGLTPAIVGEKGPELIIPNSNSTVVSNQQLMQTLYQMMGVSGDRSRYMGDKVTKIDSPLSFLDTRAWTQSYSGEPLYKSFPGFRPNLSFFNANGALDIEAALAKWGQQGQAATPGGLGNWSTGMWGSSGWSSQDWSALSMALNMVPPGVDNMMRDWMTRRDQAIRSFAGSQTVSGNPLLSLTAFQNLNADRSQGGIKLPAGDQLARMLMAWAHRIPMDRFKYLLDFANTRDWLMDKLEPQGGWTDTGPIGFGSKMGLGGVGSGDFFSGVTSSSVGGFDGRGFAWTQSTVDPRTGWYTGLGYHQNPNNSLGGKEWWQSGPGVTTWGPIGSSKPFEWVSPGYNPTGQPAPAAIPTGSPLAGPGDVWAPPGVDEWIKPGYGTPYDPKNPGAIPPPQTRIGGPYMPYNNYGGGRRSGGDIDGMHYYQVHEGEYVFSNKGGHVVPKEKAQNALENLGGKREVMIELINQTSGHVDDYVHEVLEDGRQRITLIENTRKQERREMRRIAQRRALLAR